MSRRSVLACPDRHACCCYQCWSTEMTTEVNGIGDTCRSRVSLKFLLFLKDSVLCSVLALVDSLWVFGLKTAPWSDHHVWRSSEM